MKRLLVVALAAAALTVGSAPAGARAAVGTVKVSPAKHLVDGQTVTVSWKAWPLRGGHSDEMWLMQCYDGWQYGATGTCASPTRVIMTRSKKGTYAFTVALAARADGVPWQWDCNSWAGGCWMVLANHDHRALAPGAWIYAAGAALSFRPS